MSDKCFCHLGEYQVKDAVARQEIAEIKEQIANGGTGGGNVDSKKLYLREYIITLGTDNFNDPYGEVRVKLLTTIDSTSLTYAQLNILRSNIVNVTGNVVFYDTPSSCYPITRIQFNNTDGREKMVIHYHSPNAMPSTVTVDYTNGWSNKISHVLSTGVY